MKAMSRRLVEKALQCVVCELTVSAAFKFSYNLGLCVRQHTIKPAEHDKWKHDPFVLGRAIGTAQQVCNLPD
jgi:hypothetical protein